MNSLLSSWSDAGTKQNVPSFNREVTTPGRDHFVSPAGRIATFDNDGTLWLEKPLYIQRSA